MPCVGLSLPCHPPRGQATFQWASVSLASFCPGVCLVSRCCSSALPTPSSPVLPPVGTTVSAMQNGPVTGSGPLPSPLGGSSHLTCPVWSPFSAACAGLPVLCSVLCLGLQGMDPSPIRLRLTTMWWGFILRWYLWLGLSLTAMCRTFPLAARRVCSPLGLGPPALSSALRPKAGPPPSMA